MLALLFKLPVSKPALLRLRDGTQFKVRTAMDVWIIIETYLGRDYEQYGFDIQRNWCVIDIGAGLGEFTIAAAKKCQEGIVYAYEPFPESFELLQQNLRLNRVDNVVAHSRAVGSSTEVMHLNTTSGVPVLYSTAMNNTQTSELDVLVETTTLDKIFETCGIEACDLLKMDCEGAEYDILFHTGVDTFQKMKRICLEYHNGITEYSHLDLIDFLKTYGFSVITNPNPVHKHTGLLFAWVE
jgi:FkbM family methyltransferase